MRLQLISLFLYDDLVSIKKEAGDVLRSILDDDDVVLGNAEFHRLHQRALTDRSHVGTLAD